MEIKNYDISVSSLTMALIFEEWHQQWLMNKKLQKEPLIKVQIGRLLRTSNKHDNDREYLLCGRIG